MLLEFNDLKNRLEERPAHLVEVLDNMRDTREKKIVPMVNVAAATLQQFPGVEAEFDVLYSNMTKMLDNLEKYKKLCELNNCVESRST